MHVVARKAGRLRASDDYATDILDDVAFGRGERSHLSAGEIEPEITEEVVARHEVVGIGSPGAA